MIEGISQMGSFITPFFVEIIDNAGQSPVAFISIIVLILGIVPLKFVKQTFVRFPEKGDASSDEDDKKESLIEETIQNSR